MIRKVATALLLAGLATHYGHGATPESQPKTAGNPYVVAPASRSYLGVDIRDITSDRMSALKLKEERGVEITMVDGDAPAAKAGLREHDVILGFNGTAVESEEQLRRLIRETPPGRTVTLDISRDGAPMKVTAQLADRGKVAADSFPRFASPPRFPDFSDLPNRMDIPAFGLYSTVLGMQTENLTRQLGEFFGVKNGEGVLVRNVDRGSAAAQAGLKAGDVIIKIDDEKLSDRTDMLRILRRHRESGKLNFLVMRDKKEQTLTVSIPQRGTRDSSALDMQLQTLESGLRHLESLRPEVLAQIGNPQAGAAKQWANFGQEISNGISDYGDAVGHFQDEWIDLNRALKHLNQLFRSGEPLDAYSDRMI